MGRGSVGQNDFLFKFHSGGGGGVKYFFNGVYDQKYPRVGWSVCHILKSTLGTFLNKK